MKNVTKTGIGSGAQKSGIGRGIGTGSSALGSQRMMNNNFGG